MRRILLLLLVALAVTSCTDDSKPSGGGASSSGAPHEVKTVAQLTFDGDGPLGTEVNTESVRCQFPDIDGRSIAVLVTLGDGTTVRLSVFEKDVVAKVSTGSGSSYAERDFKGTGVTGFEAVGGATVDASLSEVAVPGGADKGDIGVLRSVKGTVTCGDQKPGTSSVSLTGDVGDVRVDHVPLRDARVECNIAGGEISVIGVVNTAEARFLAEIGVREDGVALSMRGAEGGEVRYNGPGTKVSEDKGAHLELEAAEQATESPVRTMQIEGDVTCGTPVR